MAATSEISERQAIVWVSGFGEQSVDQGTATIARHVAAALEVSSDVSARFPTAVELRTEKYGPDDALVPTEVCTIFRQDGDAKTPVIDVYRLRVGDVLARPFLDDGTLKRAFAMGVVLLKYLGRAHRARRTPVPKTSKERRQVAVVHFYAALLLVYLLWLVVAAVVTAVGVEDDVVRTVAQGPAILGAIALTWKSDLLPALVRTSAQNTAVARYLDDAVGVDEVSGRFAHLLDHIGTRPGVAYTDVKVIGYSFGTITMLDTLFPAGREPHERFAAVSAIATIGCPFDFVRTYWPDYFTDRFPLAGAPASWVNVLNPSDVISSNFRSDDTLGPAEDTVRSVPAAAAAPVPTNFVFPANARPRTDWREALLLNGLREHGGYWPKQPSPGNTAFTLVVRALYEGTPLLAPAGVGPAAGP